MSQLKKLNVIYPDIQVTKHSQLKSLDVVIVTESHLYYFNRKKEAIEQVKNAYDSIAMEYEFFKI